ncbi:RNA polymerase sigma factor [Nocardioides nitrophenolicus]|uniref:RNA polymerase sigma factor n=1 Tax=Nocardioides nitrophenolicus TaxID=60489 RepID=UPI00195E1D7A|nr:sigma-70 family RNA polymerase sigma factor [Nocardioides nitrophenolicus]MBM7519760.1 RNA polymerase sigma factor (sigma-70 family) [Nocardioides nitrophenolicus]
METRDCSDAQLIDRVRRGEDADEAFAELFRRHRAAALRVARSIVPGEEDDAVAEAYLGLLRVLRAGGGPTYDVRGYVLTSARNRAIQRAQARSRAVATAEPVLDGDGVEDDHTWAVEGDLLTRAFQALAPRQRQVLWAVDVEGHRPRELAAALGCEPAAISAVAHRARRRLRTLYLAQLAPVDTRVAVVR